MVEYGIREEIDELVEKCEEYAQEKFESDEYFTQVTKWQDGDFRILVHHGKGYDTPDENQTKQDVPYAKNAEQITYIKSDGHIVYVDKTRRIDRHSDIIHESEELEHIVTQ